MTKPTDHHAAKPRARKTDAERMAELNKAQRELSLKIAMANLQLAYKSGDRGEAMAEAIETVGTCLLAFSATATSDVAVFEEFVAHAEGQKKP